MKFTGLLSTFLTFTLLCDASEFPVSHQNRLPETAIQPWATEHWVNYSGYYGALEVDGTGHSRIILTAFAGAKDAKLISACLIIVADSFVEPTYQIHGSISSDETTGELEAYSINDWKMIRYVDPNTKELVFGISADGRVYVDHSKTKPAEQDTAVQSATAE